MKKVFIDGEHGTTGLEIKQRLTVHLKKKIIQLISLSQSEKKSIQARLSAIKNSDLTILCLPDNASKEIVNLIDEQNIQTHIIDASSAHRTLWTYGFPEINNTFYSNRLKQRELIKKSQRVTNPGCYAMGAIALAKPLIDLKVLDRNFPFIFHGVSGYSGGGKQMILDYQSTQNSKNKYIYSPYSLELNHKHIKEIKHVGQMSYNPLFLPAVSPHYRGMLILMFLHQINISNVLFYEKLIEVYQKYYKDELIFNIEYLDNIQLRDGNFLNLSLDDNPNDKVKIFILNNKELENNSMIVAAHFDNLGKGAAGSVVQNLNIIF